MTLYAAERIDDAVSLTRSLLFPADWRLWAKLALVGAFVAAGSGGGGAVSSATNLPSTAGTVGDPPRIEFEPGQVVVPEGILLAVVAVVGALVLFGLAVAAVGAVMEFVLVEALASGEVRLRAWTRRYARRGLRLFGFRLVLGGVATVLVVGTALALFWPELSTALAGGGIDAGAASIVGRVLVVVGLGLTVGLPVALVHGVTTEFVVPVMLRRDCGVLAGWRRFWSTLRTQLTQYGAYLLIGFALRVGTAVAAGIVVSILAVVVLVPFAAVGLALGLGALAGGTLSLALVLGVVVLAAGYVLALVLVSATVYVPVRAFHRYFALLVLGDTDAELDVLGERRPDLVDPSEKYARG
jgi:hypothetical protein